METKIENPSNILIVDDNPKNIQVIGNILGEAGYTIGYATDGKMALSILRSANDYDLVLLDIDMPIMNGIETCKEMKKDLVLKELPVIFLTAFNETEKIIEGFESGAQDYVTKPFNSRELLARIDTHLQLKHKTDLLKDYAHELEKLIATKDKFFSIIAHDLRNPFSGLFSMSQLLLKYLAKYDIQEIEQKVQLIYSSAKNGLELLENLMTWSRSQMGRIEFNPSEIVLNDIVENCFGIINAQAVNKNITLTNIVPKDLTFQADPIMLETILRNLLTNALKFTPEQGTVSVKSTIYNDYIEIAVMDTGTGIPKEAQQKLFRIDATYKMPGTNNESGTGLGLILCKEFVEKHNGTIWVESEEGKGSKFIFSIPISA